MSVTAHKITHTFHVNYGLERVTKQMTEHLETELFAVITTELLDALETELHLGTAELVRSHKTGHNTFVATNRGWE